VSVGVGVGVAVGVSVGVGVGVAVGVGVGVGVGSAPKSACPPMYTAMPFKVVSVKPVRPAIAVSVKPAAEGATFGNVPLMAARIWLALLYTIDLANAPPALIAPWQAAQFVLKSAAPSAEALLEKLPFNAVKTAKEIALPRKLKILDRFVFVMFTPKYC
jgi:hypothetical protein